jgi:hypothetical protein
MVADYSALLALVFPRLHCENGYKSNQARKAAIQSFVASEHRRGLACRPLGGE